VPKPGDKIIVVGGRRPGLERKKHADLHRRVGAAAAVGVVAGPATATVGGQSLLMKFSRPSQPWEISPSLD
jgi:hypothetical protein